MNFFKPAAFALLASVAFAGPVLAAAEGVMAKEKTMMMVWPDGRMSTVTMDDKMMMDNAIKNGKVVTGAHMFVMNGGKMYIVEDRKMDDGKMWSEHMALMPAN